MNILNSIRSPHSQPDDNSIAIITKERKVTYKELGQLIDKCVNFLSGFDINKNDLVTLVFKNNPEFIVTILSLWELGAVPVPLNIKLTENELNSQIEFLNSTITIKDEELTHLKIKSLSTIISFEEIPENLREIKEFNFLADKLALILFTSGSTGKPKAVMLGFENLFQSTLNGNRVLNQTKDDKWLASLPFYHIGGFSIILRALYFRATIIIPDSLSTDDLISSINTHKPTLASLVSNQLKSLVDSDIKPPKELRTVLLGGGFTNSELILKAINKGWQIAKVYGSTETSSFISFMNTDEVKQKPDASGKAVISNKIYTSDNEEILIESPAVMRGYYNDTDETSARLKNNTYYTGDIGHIDEEGYLFIKAKRDDLIITGGENVNPVEIEKMILTNDNVKEVCVVGIEDEKWGQTVSAVVVLKEKLTEAELINYLKEKLSSFKVPKKIIFADELPKSELGKVQREKIKSLFKDNI